MSNIIRLGPNQIHHGRQILHSIVSPISLFSEQKTHFHEQFEQNDPQTSKFNLSNPTNTLLLGMSSFSDKINILILDATRDSILSEKDLMNIFSKSNMSYLTDFQLIFNFYTHWKLNKISVFLIFSEGIEVEHWLKMC